MTTSTIFSSLSAKPKKPIVASTSMQKYIDAYNNGNDNIVEMLSADGYTKYAPGDTIVITRTICDAWSNTYLCGSTARAYALTATERENIKYAPNDVDIAIEAADPLEAQRRLPKMAGRCIEAIQKDKTKKNIPPAYMIVSKGGGFGKPGYESSGLHIYLVNHGISKYYVIDLFVVKSITQYLLSVPFAHDGIAIPMETIDVDDVKKGIPSKHNITTKEYYHSQNHMITGRKISLFRCMNRDKLRRKHLTEEQIVDYYRRGVLVESQTSGKLETIKL